MPDRTKDYHAKRNLEQMQLEHGRGHGNPLKGIRCLGRMGVEGLLAHLPVPRYVSIQTDNCREFVGSWQQKGPGAFTRLVENRYHAVNRTIPPAAHTYQSDVETFHRLIEQELFLVESFHNRSDFLDKVCTCQLFFNYARTNSYKRYQNPISIIRQRDPAINPAIAMLQPIFLESILPRVTMYPSWSP